MASRIQNAPTLLRDWLLAAVLLGLLVTAAAFDAGPGVFEAIGSALAAPMTMLFAFLGGELENDAGPSLGFVLGYALSLGLVTAILARLVRRHVDTRRLATVKFLVAAIAGVVGALSVLYAVGGISGVLQVSRTAASIALVGGLAVIGAGLLLVTNEEDRE